MNLEKLFGSRCRKKILEKFIFESQLTKNAGFFIRELSRDINEQLNAVRRELMNLEALGIMASRTKDNKKIYYLKDSCAIVPHLTEIFFSEFDGVSKIKEFFKGKRSINLLVATADISNIRLKNTNNIVDIFIIGEIEKGDFSLFLQKTFFGRKIKYAVLSKDDFLRRLHYNDKLIVNILLQKDNIFIKDNLGVQEQLPHLKSDQFEK